MIKIYEAMGVSELEGIVNSETVKKVLCVASKGVGFVAVCEMSDKYVAPVPGDKPNRAALKAARQPVKPAKAKQQPVSSMNFDEDKPGRGKSA